MCWILKSYSTSYQKLNNNYCHPQIIIVILTNKRWTVNRQLLWPVIISMLMRVQHLSFKYSRLYRTQWKPNNNIPMHGLSSQFWRWPYDVSCVNYITKPTVRVTFHFVVIFVWDLIKRVFCSNCLHCIEKGFILHVNHMQ